MSLTENSFSTNMLPKLRINKNSIQQWYNIYPKQIFCFLKFHLILYIWILKILALHCLLLNDTCMSYTNIKKETVRFSLKNKMHTCININNHPKIRFRFWSKIWLSPKNRFRRICCRNYWNSNQPWYKLFTQNKFCAFWKFILFIYMDFENSCIVLFNTEWHAHELQKYFKKMYF